MKPLFVVLILSFLPIANAADWPHWRGANRDGISSESTGWEEGIRLPNRELWQINLGAGASSPLIVDGTLYTLGWKDNQDTLYALDAATGEVKWSQSYSAPKYGRHARGDQGYFSGSISTPEFDAETGYLYSLSCDGDLNCWDTKNEGAKVWGLNFYERYNIPRRPQVTDRRGSLRDYGYTSAPFVHGDLVIVEVGSLDHGNVIAFDKKSGNEIWKSENRQPAGHSGGLAPITIEGVTCAAVLTARNLHVLRLDNGKTVAEFPWATDFINNIPTPAVNGNRVIISSRYNQNAMVMVEVSLNGGAREVWKIKDATGVCSPVIYDGHVYWSGKGLYCIELETGKKKWEGSKFGDAGSCIVTADGRLIVWSDGGSLTFVETAKRSPDRYTPLLRKDNVFRGMAWPHVVLADRRIYCRDISGDMKCFSLRKDEQTAPPVMVSTPDKSTTPSAAPPADLDLTNWPGENDPGLFFGWKRGMGKAAPLGAIAKNRVRLSERDGARFDDAGRMTPNGGSFHVLGATNPFLAAAQESGQLTIETIITTTNLRQSGPARIITFSSDGHHRNFSLAQERERLLLRLRTPQTGENGMKPQSTLCAIEAGKTLHILVSYRDGELTAYVNGERVFQSDGVTGDFSNWDDQQQLVFGAEFSDGRNWEGTFDGIALLTRFVGAEEAVARYQSATGGKAP
ncbi:MAG: PQQ-binding-like beta-propeller repeat protein [Verrucomicrobiota bacterium]